MRQTDIEEHIDFRDLQSQLLQAEPRLELSDKLGKGGQAVVYRGRFHPGGRGANGRSAFPQKRAIKVCPLQGAAVPRELEVQIKAWFAVGRSHYVVQLYNYHILRSYLVLEMEMCDDSLQGLLLQCAGGDEVGLSRTDCRDHLSDIARGLSAMHRQEPPIFHGDVKPSNMLLKEKILADGGSERITMLCDFGCAAVQESQSVVYSCGMTEQYLLPRKDEVPKLALTPERDLFALAVSYAQMRLGRLPFRNKDGLDGLPRGGRIDLEGLDADEQEVLMPVLRGEVPKIDVYEWFRRLEPSQPEAQSSADKLDVARFCLDRYVARRDLENLNPHDIEDLLQASQTLGDETPESLYLKARLLEEAGDLKAACIKAAEEQSSPVKYTDVLFEEALEAISSAITRDAKNPIYFALRAELRIKRVFGGHCFVSPVLAAQPHLFDAPNYIWSEDAHSWDAIALAAALADLDQALELHVTPLLVARRSQLLTARAIYLDFKGEWEPWPGAEDLPIWIDAEDCVDEEGEVGANCEHESGQFILRRELTTLFQEAAAVLTAEIESCQDFILRARLLVQRSWTIAGFEVIVSLGSFSSFKALREHAADRDVEWPVGSAVADLEEALHLVQKSESAPGPAGLPWDRAPVNGSSEEGHLLKASLIASIEARLFRYAHIAAFGIRRLPPSLARDLRDPAQCETSNGEEGVPVTPLITYLENVGAPAGCHSHPEYGDTVVLPYYAYTAPHCGISTNGEDNRTLIFAASKYCSDFLRASVWSTIFSGERVTDICLHASMQLSSSGRVSTLKPDVFTQKTRRFIDRHGSHSLRTFSWEDRTVKPWITHNVTAAVAELEHCIDGETPNSFADQASGIGALLSLAIDESREWIAIGRRGVASSNGAPKEAIKYIETILRRGGQPRIHYLSAGDWFVSANGTEWSAEGAPVPLSKALSRILADGAVLDALAINKHGEWIFTASRSFIEGDYTDINCFIVLDPVYGTPSNIRSVQASTSW